VRAPWVLAWSLWLVGTAGAAGGLLLAGREVGVLATIVAGFSTVGALVASRHPFNPIGWVFCGTGLVAAGQALALAFALESLRAPALLPGGLVSAWVQEWAWIPLIGLPSVVVLLLFPDGRLPSPRWRPVLWIGLVAMGVACLGFALKPGPLTNEPRLSELTNPFGVVPGAETIGLIAFVLLLVTALVAVASQVVRYRRAGGDQRQQIKWFAYGGTLMGTTVVAGSALWQVSPIAQQLVPLSLVLGPLGAGIGILRYRLYDIDLVINRTLVYGALTILLGFVYVGLVVALGGLLRPVTGSNDLAVAGSTLVVAALFSPARRRIQGLVDRRFYRSRYDAARTVEAFSSRLRDQVDLETLRADLTGVVRETLQPASVSVWLRESEAGR
jgi:hypothetical protein